MDQYAKIEPEKWVLIVRMFHCVVKINGLSRVKLDEDIPIFYVSFKDPKKMENVQKLECKDKS